MLQHQLAARHLAAMNLSVLFLPTQYLVMASSILSFIATSDFVGARTAQVLAAIVGCIAALSPP